MDDILRLGTYVCNIQRLIKNDAKKKNKKRATRTNLQNIM